MSPYIVDEHHILSESDVEQKVILPLLQTAEPIGLGYNYTHIQTKVNLQKLNLDKGHKSILYYPDFVINIDGIPLIVVEAKKPHEDLNEAFRQASLYASEINRKFKEDLNPCKLIIACDGLNLLAGSWDSSTPDFTIEVKDWVNTEESFNNFCIKFNFSSLLKRSKEIRKSIKAKKIYKKPLSLLGGKHIQNQSTDNTFGETISSQYRHLFNPNVEGERVDIVKNAYVQVTRYDSHVAPIDKLIRKKIRPAIKDSIEIDDNVSPTVLLNKLKNAHDYNNQVILLIGSVGAGKSTFATFLKEVALVDTTEYLCWLRLDLNNAPVNREEIYLWIKTQIIEQIQNLYPSIDFSSLESIEMTYKEQISSLKKGVLKLLNPESDMYKETLVNNILQFQSDIDVTVKAYIRQYIHEYNKELIIVLDNCDKRNLEEQLLMFDVANYVKDNVKCIVFLPLRDTTFDHFRNEKPLDTVIKDLIFRINPPSLEKVIYNRIKYANRLAERSSERFYYLPNGFKVSYPSADELYYLKSILTSLFQNNFFKRVIAGLTGSDIRRGIEIFLDFCKSGHISDREIFKIKQQKGEHVLPNHIISRVFLRGNRIYYSDSEARIKNLFHSDPYDDLPDPFVRLAILKWLHDRLRLKGPSGIIGFHKAESLISDLTRLGHAYDRVQEELINSLRFSLIISESQNSNKIDLDELLSINTPGIIHIELLKNIDYLSSCSEDIWYNDESIAYNIAKDMSGQGSYAHLTVQNSITHTNILIEYLEKYFEDNFSLYTSYLSEDLGISPLNFKQTIRDIKELEDSLQTNNFKQLEIGAVLNGKIVNIMPYGLLFELENTHELGLIHRTDIADIDFDQTYKLEDVLRVKIKEYKPEYQKYNLTFA